MRHEFWPYYWLDDAQQPVQAPRTDEGRTKWTEWFERDENRRVKETITMGVRVSTVFLGIDHSFGSGPPVLWETMTFAGGDRLHLPIAVQTRYTSVEDAILGHELIVAEVEILREQASRDRETSGD